MKTINNALLTGIICAVCSTTAFANGQHSVYGHTGISTFSKDGHSQSGLYFQGGYNYYLTPFFALDLNYTRANSLNVNLAQNSPDFSAEADGFGAGVKLEHYAGPVSMHARGGVSSLRIKTEFWDTASFDFKEESDTVTSPYFEVGVGMISPWDKNLNVSVTYNKQTADDVWDISTFTISGAYLF
ncbi:outer membrane beta-barrel protein [Vibrio intestinalis]|uniref:outer membrane beta-barrel protein n=1 Tax=Vibrio intestinalis TaxID=2933291 RepID=UPI0021A2E20C|nr:outer membrane beta-barrel protein [Vibrio intestinalis]